jgi:RNA polymerase sigma-70 factor (ECF subfamily)
MTLQDKASGKRFQQRVDDSVLHAAKSGDSHAYAILYNMFSQSIMTLAYGFTRNHQSAEDIVHNTYVQLINKLSTFEGRAPFGMWLRKIAVNESLIYLRRHKKHNSAVSTDEYNILDFVQDSDDDSMFMSNCDDFSEKIDLQNDLDALLNKLPEHVRLIVWLKDVEGYTHEEIAQLVDRTPSYSKSIVMRTYKYIRARIKTGPQSQAAAI